MIAPEGCGETPGTPGNPLKSPAIGVDPSDDQPFSPFESHGEKHMERSKRTPGVNGIMDISEAADYLHIKKWTLYRLVKRGKIPGIKVGGQWRFKKEVLDDMFYGEGKGSKKRQPPSD